MIHIRRLLVLLFLAALCGTAFSQANAPATRNNLPDPALQAKIDGLLKSLASQDYSERQAAAKSIAALPAEAYLPLLTLSADPSTDPEVQTLLEKNLPALEKKATAKMIALGVAADNQRERAMALAAYEQVGNKDARWDADVRVGLRSWCEVPDPTTKATDNQAAAVALRRAVDAGCHDPMVLQALVFLMGQSPNPDYKQMQPWAKESAVKHAARTGGPKAYPAELRFNSYIVAIEVLSHGKDTPDQVRAQWVHWYEEAMAAWMEFTPTTDMSLSRLQSSVLSISQIATPVADMTLRVDDLIMNPLEKNPSTNAQAFLITQRGSQALQDAWNVLNGRVYDTFRSDGPPIHNATPERLAGDLKLARESFQKAYTLEPTSPVASTLMIQVELLDSQGRDEMEKWFRRAMLANPNNPDACNAKLNYLLPRWHGSHEEMVAFGKECVADGNWAGRIPYTLIAAHMQIATETGLGDAYYAQPEVWKDIQTVFDGVIKFDPKNMLDRSNYMHFAVLAQQWAVAAEQQKVIGNNPDLSIFKTKENYLQLCQQIAEHQSGQPARITPP